MLVDLRKGSIRFAAYAGEEFKMGFASECSLTQVDGAAKPKLSPVSETGLSSDMSFLLVYKLGITTFRFSAHPTSES
jgi:hypothetical protein